MPRPRSAERLTIRAALLVGFGLTLGLWLLAGYQVTLRMREAQSDFLEASARYLRSEDILASVRTQVLVASVFLRDALLDPQPDTVEGHRQEITRAYDTIDDLLARYEPFLDTPAERERVGRLRNEIRAFRSASDEVLATDSSRWSTDAQLLLRRFMPKRESVIRVSESVQRLNRSGFIVQQRTISEMQASLQRRVWTVFGVALAINVAIGVLAFRHSTRLEHRLTEQRGREARISTDLQRLSARLVQVQEDEQRRIARELHDEVGQALSAVKVELAVAQRTLDRMTGGAVVLSDAQSSADTALRSVRDLSRLLHPSALDDLGLVAALDSQVADFRRRHRVSADFVHDGIDGRQSAETERAVYRIVQEALTNIARHSQAEVVRVSLRADVGTVRVVIEDEGVGFDVADAERPGVRRGLGLLGIRERVSQLGGTVKIESAPTRGTRIEVELPVREPPLADEEVSAELVESTLLAGRVGVDHG